MTSVPFYLRVILVRHGQSANNALVEGSGGWTAYYRNRTADAPLTDIGREQAKKVGSFLSKMASESPVPIKRFYTSCMKRALETSSLIYQEALSSTLDSGKNEGSSATSHCSVLPRPSVFVDTFEIGGLFDKKPDADLEKEPDSSTWMGINGLSREGVQELFPVIDLGSETEPPIPPAKTSTNFSTYTAGVLSHRGWYEGKQKEDESEGAARTIRIVEAFKALAVSLLVKERGEDAGKEVKKPLGVGVTPDGSQGKKHDGEAVILVCHGDFINVFLRACVGDPGMTLEAAESGGGRGEGLQFAVNNCSCSIVDFMPGDSTVRIIRINDVRGVGEELLTGAPR
jgi:broad specificity phosphatase PhoE